MEQEIKTLADWQQYVVRTGNSSIRKYLYRGDLVSGDLVDYLKDTLQVRYERKGCYVQLNEIQGYDYNSIRAVKPLYLTFQECSTETWIYVGCCFLYHSQDRSLC